MDPRAARDEKHDITGQIEQKGYRCRGPDIVPVERSLGLQVQIFRGLAWRGEELSIKGDRFSARAFDNTAPNWPTAPIMVRKS